MTYTINKCDGEIRSVERADGKCFPANPLNPDYQEYLAWVEAGNVPAEATIETFSLESFIQGLIDAEARSRGYDSIVSACSYAGYENAFQAEAVQLGKWRSAVWAAAYAYLAEVKAGTKEMPSADEVIRIMPKVADYA